MNAIDLFCGAGGMSLGLEAAGFEILAAVDNWEPAIRTYGANFDHPLIDQDIGSLSGDELRGHLDSSAGAETIDLVVGGPPCQGFSIQRIGPDLDARNELVLEFARLVAELQPRYFVMENVRGLVGRRGQPLLRQLIHMLEAASYQVEVEHVDAVEFGVPQRRRRVFVLGWRAGQRPLIIARPEVATRTTVWEAIGDLADPPTVATPGADPLHVQSRLSDLNRRRLEFIPPGGGFEDLPEDLRVDCHRAGADKIGHRNVYGRLSPDEPAVTITARFDSFTRGKFAHPYQDRNITLREGARLQTFPDEFEFHGNREQIAALIGNAVPPMLAASIAQSVAWSDRGCAEELSPRLF